MTKGRQDKGIKGPGASLESVDSSLLEAIDYSWAQIRSLEIVIEQPEFTSLCPKTGLPDFGTICIRYCPDKLIVELKSLKYYLLQYRTVGVFYEHAVNRILDDLLAVLSPRWMEVSGSFTARGGIRTSATARFGL
ncbi:MAG: preQ(1) synthase [Desulfatibacillaceae bacterium]|nr:preQ(1) synthase [Desulfatibacillaceae bacterium]